MLQALGWIMVAVNGLALSLVAVGAYHYYRRPKRVQLRVIK